MNSPVEGPDRPLSSSTRNEHEGPRRNGGEAQSESYGGSAGCTFLTLGSDRFRERVHELAIDSLRSRQCGRRNFRVGGRIQ